MAECNIHAEGGPLWQWDLGRTVHVLDFEAGDVLDFAQAGSCDSVMVAIGADGRATVPNALLKRADGIRVWQRRNGETVYAAALAVKARTKPDDYQYVATPTIGYGELSEEMNRRFEEIEELIGKGGAVTSVEEPLRLEDGVLSIDLAGAVRGTQVSIGEDVPTAPGIRGDSYIRTDGTLYEYAEVE